MTRIRLGMVLVFWLLTAACLGGEEPLPATGVPGADSPRGGDVERALALVERLDINEVGSAPVQVFVTAHGNLTDGCTNLDEVTQDRDGETIEVAVTTIRPSNAACTEALVPFQQTIALDVLGLRAGTYTVDVNGVTAQFTLAVDNLAGDIGADGVVNGVGSVTGRVWHDLCAVGGEGGEEVVYGANCVVLVDGSIVADGIEDASEPGLEGIVVALHVGACPATGDSVATAVTDADGAYTLDNVAPGTYCVSVSALEEPNLSALVPGQWTYPPGETGAVTVTVAGATVVENVNFGWDYQFLPVLIAHDCVDRAGFVLDVTVPDNSVFDGGRSFVKTWRLRNDGTCAWDERYALVLAGGDALGAGTAVSIPATEPGATADVSVELVAPDVAGTYRGDWLLRDPVGGTFGIGPAGDDVFWVQIVSRGRDVSAATATPAPATPAATATASATGGSGVIGGRVWLDICHVAGGEGDEPAVPSDGCVTVGEGSYQANGVMEAAEPGVSGVSIALRGGTCEGATVATTESSADGSYAFANLVGGDYCVVVDALSGDNADRLIPGGWTTPPEASAVAAVLVSLPDGATRADVNFGWDFQFD